MQLDIGLRLFGSSLVEDVNDFVGHALKFGRIDRYQDRSGNLLQDRYLVDRLSELSPKLAWVRTVYAFTSGFVHMSARQMLNMAEITGDRTIEFEIARHDDLWPEAEMGETVDTFLHATDLVLWLVLQWLDQKSNYAAPRSMDLGDETNPCQASQGAAPPT